MEREMTKKKSKKEKNSIAHPQWSLFRMLMKLLRPYLPENAVYYQMNVLGSHDYEWSMNNWNCVILPNELSGLSRLKCYVFRQVSQEW